MRPTNAIVVGVDGSHDGLRAAHYGALEAAALGLPVHLVHAYAGLGDVDPLLSLFGDEELRRYGERSLESAEALVGEIAPKSAVTRTVARGTPAHALARAADHDAHAIVLGRRRKSDEDHFHASSTVVAVAAGAAVPVVAVPDSWTPSARAEGVVVGVDGSPLSDDALAFAFEEAGRRRVPLTIVRAWDEPRSWHDDIHGLDDATVGWLERAERLMAEELAGWHDRYPDVEVTRLASRSSSAAGVLVSHARATDLLVVGARGRGGLPTLALGETARLVLTFAPCPVFVVHTGDVLATEEQATGT